MSCFGETRSLILAHQNRPYQRPRPLRTRHTHNRILLPGRRESSRNHRHRHMLLSNDKRLATISHSAHHRPAKLIPTSPGMVSLPPMTITQLAKDPSEYGTRIGMGYTVASIGALLGSPLAGLALSQEAGPKGHAVALSTDAARAAYRGVWLVAGSSMAVSCGLMVLVRFMVAGRKWRAKV